MNNRVVWMDILKIICAYMIVVIHISGEIFNNSFGTGNANYYGGLVLNSVVRFAVPCFLMISGILLLSRERSFSYGVSKAGKLFGALVFWSIMYLLFQRMVWNNDFNIMKEICTIPVQGKTGHMWYIYQLIWLYLIVEILYRFYHSLTKKQIAWFILIVLWIPSIIDFIYRMFTSTGIQYISSWCITLGLPYIGYIFMGRYIYERVTQASTEQKQKYKMVAFVMILVGIIFMVISANYLSLKNGAASHDLFGELRLPSVVLGVAVFAFFVCIGDSFDNLGENIKHHLGIISDALLQVYLGHIILQWWMSTKVVYDSVGKILTLAFLQFVICIVLSCIWNKVKKVIPGF